LAMVCLVITLDTTGLNLTYLIMLSIYDKEGAFQVLFSYCIYVFSYLVVLPQLMGFSFMHVLSRHVLLQVPSNTLLLSFISQIGSPVGTALVVLHEFVIYRCVVLDELVVSLTDHSLPFFIVCDVHMLVFHMIAELLEMEIENYYYYYWKLCPAVPPFISCNLLLQSGGVSPTFQQLSEYQESKFSLSQIMTRYLNQSPYSFGSFLHSMYSL
jgi:hypothetical protein